MQEVSKSCNLDYFQQITNHESITYLPLIPSLDDTKEWKEFTVWESRKVGFYLKSICHQRLLNKEGDEAIHPRTTGVTRSEGRRGMNEFLRHWPDHLLLVEVSILNGRDSARTLIGHGVIIIPEEEGDIKIRQFAPVWKDQPHSSKPQLSSANN